MLAENVATALQAGLVIPASPLALTADRKLDERRQRALCRYYAAAGVGGLAVGVHTTQFAIRDPNIGLFEPVLALVSEELDRADLRPGKRMVRIAGICGDTDQAVREAALARDLKYDAGLVNLGALKTASEIELIEHCNVIAAIIPLFGFYLHPSAGGRLLSHHFWRKFVEIQSVVAIKIAAFNRYQTLDVIRAAAESGRTDIALYTGNDDNIVLDLVTPYRFTANGKRVERRMSGGLLGHWAVWTRRAVEIQRECRSIADTGVDISPNLLRLNGEVTDCNSAVFDAANGFVGCIPGIHEVLRRQGLLEGTWCLNPSERISPGQLDEIDRVCRDYRHLNDDEFVEEHRDTWLSG